MMTTEQTAFFELVRAGLWGTPADPSAFGPGTDWNALYDRARSQTLLGIVLDGIQTLPGELRPDRTLYLRWCASVLRIEESNRKLNEEVGKVFALLRGHGIEPVLLKGQGAARNYPEPLHRQCGDIDIYTGKDNFARANGLLRIEGTEDHEANFKHSSFRWHGVSVENHRLACQMRAPRADRRLQRNIASWQRDGGALRFPLGDCEVTVPPVEFDAVFLLQHSVSHLLDIGIGLRQTCDWACLLHVNRDRIDRGAVARELSALGLDRAARTFGALAVRCLGLPPEDLPLPFGPEDEKTAQWLLGVIWNSGNFGKSDTTAKARPAGYWRGKWHFFCSLFERRRNFSRIVPDEAFWAPFRAVSNFITSQRFRRRRSPLV